MILVNKSRIMANGSQIDKQAEEPVENRLREKRQLLGLSQKTLADLAGITRQSVGAIEANLYSPATVVALRLARALKCRVEDLFSVKAAPEFVEGELVGRLPAGISKSRVKVTRVGERLLIRPLSALGGFSVLTAGSDGFVLGPRRPGKRVNVQLLRERREVDGQIAIAGCDPAIALAAEYVRRNLRQDCALPCVMGSSAAVEALKRGEVHVAGVHLADSDTGEWNLPYLRRHLKDTSCLVVTFASWEEGLIVARGNPKGIHSMADLVRKDVKLVNREAGTGARHLLDRQMTLSGLSPDHIRGYADTVPSHVELAWMIKGGIADVGVGARVAASAFEVDFIPLQTERYDFVIPRVYYDTHPSLKAFLDTIVSGSFRTELEALGGYDTRE
ncbi:MAG: helix-turn-helix domain-containing protein, partial [Deltaproteobacteria bacterium]|nr:helix-turn-helix domain-containing protein [Deltaproteobacteria bacterium]